VNKIGNVFHQTDDSSREQRRSTITN